MVKFHGNIHELNGSSNTNIKWGHPQTMALSTNWGLTEMGLRGDFSQLDQLGQVGIHIPGIEIEIGILRAYQRSLHNAGFTDSANWTDRQTKESLESHGWHCNHLLENDNFGDVSMFELWPKPAHGNLAWWATMLSSFGVCLEIEYPSSVQLAARSSKYQ